MLLIDRCDDDAPLEAAARADDLFDDGDLDGAKIWRGFLRVIGEFKRDKPNEASG